MEEKGDSVFAIAAGVSFTEDLLMTLAQAGQGHFCYVRNPEESSETFAEELEGLPIV